MDIIRLREIVTSLKEYKFECEAGYLTDCILFKQLENIAFPFAEIKYPEKLERPVIFLDAETTGTNIQEDRIVELCILKYYGGNKWDGLQVRRLNPGIPIPKAATDVHGITDAQVKNEPTFPQVAKNLFTIIDGCDIIGYNSNNFDCPLLFFEFQRAGIYWDYSKVNLIDVAGIYKQRQDRTLSSAAMYYLGLQHDEAHKAEGDVVVTRNIFFQQLACYADLPKHYAELALYSNFNRKVIDISGKFTYNDGGEIVFTFGQHKDKPVKEEIKYLQWMIDTGTFNSDTKHFAAKFIYEYGKKK